LNTKQLQVELRSNKLRTHYLFIGYDDYIARSYLKLLRDAAVSELPVLNDKVYEQKGAEVQDILNELWTLPILSHHRFILISEKALTEELKKAIIGYLDNPNPQSVLVLYLSQVDKRTSFYKAFSKVDSAIEFEKLPYSDLSKWIVSTLAKKNIRIDDDALRYFTQTADYNARESEIDLGYFVSEIDKILSYDPNLTKLTVATLRKTLSSNVNEDIFALSDNILSGNLDRVNAVMAKLAFNKVAPQRIISEITRVMRLLCVIHSESLSLGTPQEQIAKKYGYHPYVVKKTLALKDKFSVAQGKEALKACLNADMQIKFGVMDPQVVCDILVADITAKSFILS
jgi:DNA polymerase-3 subunit delta